MSRLNRIMAKAMGHAPDEKWQRWQVDIPPEMADVLMRLHRADMGVNASAASRQGALRSALLEWWETRDPEPEPAIDGTATDVIERPALPVGGER